MSYLDLPRIQFGGLFFTNPDTINNYIGSFNPDTQLKDDQGAYISRPPSGAPAGWNATGVAQLWLQECRVLSAVDATGRLLATSAADPVVGAPVESPSPTTPKKTPDGKGFYDIAKMVDLDPYQQTRSAVYGLRLYVTLPGGGGFSGLLSVPELQSLNGRVPVRTGSWAAVGTWMGQIAEVAWEGDVSSSPFLAELRAAAGRGIAVKLTVDLHQNNNATRLTPGNMFCYGRVLGSIGPVLEGELPQVVPGRQLGTPPAATRSLRSAAPEAEAETEAEGSREFVPRTIEDLFREAAATRATRAVAAESESEAEAPLPWNPAPARVTAAAGAALLHLDLGGSIQLDGRLENGVGVSDGKFVVDSGIAVGYLDGGSFKPLSQGAVSFEDRYQFLDSTNKRVNLVTDSGIVEVPLTSDEASQVAGKPLAVQLGTTTVLQEPADGLLAGSNPFSVRLVPGGSGSIQLMVRRFGRPVAGQRPVTWQVFAVSGNNLQPSTEVVLAWAGSTDAHGVATLSVSTPDGAVDLPAARVPLDSMVYYVYLLDASGQPIADGAGNANLSVLRFQPYTVPDEPTWQQDVEPVLGAYARLYPGMKDRLDIGDEATVKSFAGSVYGHMALPFLDPAYMPVTRDLSPAKVQMVLRWLRPYLPAEGSGGDAPEGTDR